MIPGITDAKQNCLRGAHSCLVASIAIASIPTFGNITRGIAVVPAAVALIGATFQLLRDQLGHDRAVALQVAQMSFSIGATSHMATVAFDKHVVFAEEYVAETQRSLAALFQSGPAEEALNHAAKLYDVRRRSALWLTPELDAKLERFESALQEIGASADFVDVARDHADRHDVIERMHKLFAEVTGMKIWHDQPISPDRAITTAIQILRRMLGIEELTHLRQQLVSQAQRQTSAPAVNVQAG
jgi:hypothetical protein